jgi:hypothetical protein
VAGTRLPVWPILRLLRGDDRLGLGEAARSARSASLQPRTVEADRMACERWAVYKAGFQSARDPRYILGPQRPGWPSERAGSSSRKAASLQPGSFLGVGGTLLFEDDLRLRRRSLHDPRITSTSRGRGSD